MLGVFLFKSISLFLIVYHICIRKSDIESPVEDDCIPLLTTTNQNTIHSKTNKEGTSMHYENPDGSL